MTSEMENVLENLVRVGNVTAVDRPRGAARVKFQDTGLSSDWLPVLSASLWMPRVNDTVLTLYLPVFNGDGFILGKIGPPENENSGR